MDQLFMPLTVRLIRLTADSVLRLSHEGPPNEAPRVSYNWTRGFLERHPTWHKRVAKPLEIDRNSAHNIEDISAWFKLFEETLKMYSILASDLWNFDETGYNIGMAGETVILTQEPYQKHYTPSSEDRTRVSSTEGINAAGDYLPAFHILPGKCILGSWIQDLHDDDCIAVTDSGYSNDTIGFEWLKKFDESSKRYQQGVWRLLLLDNHDSHCTYDFIHFCEERRLFPLRFQRMRRISYSH
jgi:hypothetical protein